MYNRNYYAQVDDAMMKLWKDFGRRLLHVLDGTMRYVLTLPIRTYEYIYDTISGELTSQRGSRMDTSEKARAVEKSTALSFYKFIDILEA